jgi:hypothetical protein
MRIVFPNASELSTDWTVARDQLKQDLSRLQSTINNAWEIEHNADGSHGDVTADSLTLNGLKVGELQNLPYDSARYVSGGSGTWTVAEANQVRLAWAQIGRLAFVTLVLDQTIVSVDTPTNGLLIKLPEIHITPARGTTGIQWPAGTGRLKYYNHTEAISGNCDCDIYASDFANATPSTIFEFYGMTVTFASLPVTISFAGTLVFCIEENNVANPFFGS